MKRYLALTLASALLATNVVYAANDTTSSASESTEATTTTTTTTTTSVKTTVAPVLVTASSTENPEGYELYVVVTNDNLSTIAQKYDTTWQAIAELNGITHRANLIFPGEVFKIPGTEGTNLAETAEPVTPEVPVIEEPVEPVTPEVPVIEEPVEPVTPEVPVIEEPVEPVTPEVDPIVPVEPVNPIAETKNLKNGTYVGINGDYSTDEALDNWDYFVTIEVADGVITDVNWDAKSELSSTNTKKEQSEAGLYGMEAASALGKTWHEQAEFVEEALLTHQSVDVFEVDPETSKLLSIDGVDTTSSVSIKVADFVKYADQAIQKAHGELPATETVDTISSASLSTDAAVITQALSPEGNWLVAAIGDTVATEHIVVEGEFRKENATEGDLYRKFTPSNHVNNEAGRDKTKEEFYVFTAEEGMTVKSENLNMQNGTFVGDITVDAPGFTLSNMTVIGNVTFTSQEYRDSANFKNSNVTGDVTPFYATEHLNDGTYTGKVEGENYNDVVDVVVRYGKIVNVDYNPLKVVDGAETGEGKKELAEKGEYVLAETATASWAEQAATLEAYLLANYNDLDVDAISGATITIDGFLEAAKLAVEQAK
ncbi:MAG: LysM peptidoglycan-binding domain-containing protein [Lachnospirales bacterium]